MNSEKKILEDVEEKLKSQVDDMAGGILEAYIYSLKSIRELGNLVIKTHSNLEAELEEIIVAHLEGWEGRVNVATWAHAFLKYYPLLKTMYFTNKLNACQDYGYVSKNKKDKLRSLLSEINEIRNRFAHYQSYRYMLEKEYEKPQARIKLLKKLKATMELLKIKKNQMYLQSLPHQALDKKN